MNRHSYILALALLAVAAPLRADPPEDKPLPGERIGGDQQDNRANKRVDMRLPTRLETRVRPRTIGKPLEGVKSPITSDADNGCVRNSDRPATQTAQTAPVCEQPQ